MPQNVHNISETLFLFQRKIKSVISDVKFSIYKFFIATAAESNGKCRTLLHSTHNLGSTFLMEIPFTVHLLWQITPNVWMIWVDIEMCFRGKLTDLTLFLSSSWCSPSGTEADLFLLTGGMVGDPNLSSWRIGIPLLEITPGFLPSNSLTSRWGEALPSTWECWRAETAIPPELGLGVKLEELRPGQSVVVYSGVHGSPTLLPDVCEGDGPAMRGVTPSDWLSPSPRTSWCSWWGLPRPQCLPAPTPGLCPLWWPPPPSRPSSSSRCRGAAKSYSLQPDSSF